MIALAISTLFNLIITIDFVPVGISTSTSDPSTSPYSATPVTNIPTDGPTLIPRCENASEKRLTLPINRYSPTESALKHANILS